MLTCGDLNGGLRAISDFVERIITEPLCTAQVFGSKVLDELSQRIGATSLAEVCNGGFESRLQEIDATVVVYIVSRLQRSGGHTRVLEEFVQARPRVKHVILSTEICGASDADYIAKNLVYRAGVVFERAPRRKNYLQRLSWLQSSLLRLRPAKVYLLNGHQDSVAVAAVQPAMKLNVSFYHHCDHHLCLGIYVPHFKHIDPHPMGFYNCRDVLGIDNVYIPLTVGDRGGRSHGFMSGGVLTTCTAARSNKVEAPYFLSYCELVPQLLRVTGGKHVHIGHLTPWARYRIFRELRRHGVERDRFIYIPWVSSVWQSLQDHQVDLYVSSFPYGGGLTSIEAMGAGIPLALHRHIFSRLLGGGDLAYPTAFSWRYPSELFDYCASLTVSKLEEASRLGREWYEKHHDQSILRNILDNDLDFPWADKPAGDYSIAYDEWAVWMERQVSIRRVLGRAVYRIVRRIRTGIALF